jgi:hypothetical protein
MTGVTLSGSTVASNQVFEISGGRALIPNAKGCRETKVSLDGSADPLVNDRQSDTKIDIVTTPVPTVVEPPRQSRQRNIMAGYVFGKELGARRALETATNNTLRHPERQWSVDCGGRRRRARLRTAFQGREGIHNADELMSALVAKRVAAHLGRSGFCRHEEDTDWGKQAA